MLVLKADYSLRTGSLQHQTFSNVPSGIAHQADYNPPASTSRLILPKQLRLTQSIRKFTPTEELQRQILEMKEVQLMTSQKQLR